MVYEPINSPCADRDDGDLIARFTGDFLDPFLDDAQFHGGDLLTVIDLYERSEGSSKDLYDAAVDALCRGLEVDRNRVMDALHAPDITVWYLWELRKGVVTIGAVDGAVMEGSPWVDGDAALEAIHSAVKGVERDACWILPRLDRWLMLRVGVDPRTTVCYAKLRELGYPSPVLD